MRNAAAVVHSVGAINSFSDELGVEILGIETCNFAKQHQKYCYRTAMREPAGRYARLFLSRPTDTVLHVVGTNRMPCQSKQVRQRTFRLCTSMISTISCPSGLHLQTLQMPMSLKRSPKHAPAFHAAHGSPHILQQKKLNADAHHPALSCQVRYHAWPCKPCMAMPLKGILHASQPCPRNI